jgi:hypothetical protein
MIFFQGRFFVEKKIGTKTYETTVFLSYGTTGYR